MSDRTIETFQFGDNDRVRLVPDDDAQCPRGDWHMLTGFVNLEGLGDSRKSDVPAVYDEPIPITEAHDRFDEKVYPDPDHQLGWPATEEVVGRWAKIFHGLVVEYDSPHGGYWFVAGADASTAATPTDAANRALFYDNWPELVVGSPEHLAKQAEVIEQEQETYRQWADGEVYGFIHEKLSTWAKLGPDGDILYELGDSIRRDEWDEEEAMWGVCGDDLRDHARETFDLPEDPPGGLTTLARQRGILTALESVATPQTATSTDQT